MTDTIENWSLLFDNPFISFISESIQWLAEHLYDLELSTIY